MLWLQFVGKFSEYFSGTHALPQSVRSINIAAVLGRRRMCWRDFYWGVSRHTRSIDSSTRLWMPEWRGMRTLRRPPWLATPVLVAVAATAVPTARLSSATEPTLIFQSDAITHFQPNQQINLERWTISCKRCPEALSTHASQQQQWRQRHWQRLQYVQQLRVFRPACEVAGGIEAERLSM